MIYKSLIIYSYIFGYTLLTKYRNLLIFTIFFFPNRLWRLNNYLQNHFIFETWILNFYFWWYFANRKKVLLGKDMCFEFGAGFYANLQNPHEEWSLHKGPPLLEVNVLRMFCVWIDHMSAFTWIFSWIDMEKGFFSKKWIIENLALVLTKVC